MRPIKQSAKRRMSVTGWMDAERPPLGQPWVFQSPILARLEAWKIQASHAKYARAQMELHSAVMMEQARKLESQMADLLKLPE